MPIVVFYSTGLNEIGDYNKKSNPTYLKELKLEALTAT